MIRKLPRYTEPFQSYFSAGDESEIFCPTCEISLDDYEWETRQFRYCPECGQELMLLDEYHEMCEGRKEEAIELKLMEMMGK